MKRIRVHPFSIALGALTALAAGMLAGWGTTAGPPIGACCLDNGACVEITQEQCVAVGGCAYQGDGTLCMPRLCAPCKGACCFDDGMCATVTEIECVDAGGNYQGDDTVCMAGLCPQPCVGDTNFDAVVDSDFLPRITRALYYVLPNFKNFDIKAQAVAGAPLPLSQIGWATAYGLVYISLLLVVSAWIFGDRNLK